MPHVGMNDIEFVCPFIDSTELQHLVDAILLYRRIQSDCFGVNGFEFSKGDRVPRCEQRYVMPPAYEFVSQKAND